MAQCTNCGAPVKAGSKSCEYCGAPMEVGALTSVVGLIEDRLEKRDEAAAAAREAAAERERTEAPKRTRETIGTLVIMAVLMFALFAMSWDERQWATATVIIISVCVLLATLAIVALIVWKARRPKTQPAATYQASAPPAPNHQTPATPAGWYPDPTARHQHRYWAGSTWAAYVCDGDAVSEDPI